MVQGTLTTAGFDVVLAATIVALASVCIAQERTWLPPPPAEVQAFVRAALTDRFRANDIPDLKLLDATRPIGVRTVMPQARLMLIEQALPVMDGYEFFLISAADAQAAADREGKPVAFVTVDQPMPPSRLARE